MSEWACSALHAEVILGSATSRCWRQSSSTSSQAAGNPKASCCETKILPESATGLPQQACEHFIAWLTSSQSCRITLTRWATAAKHQRWVHSSTWAICLSLSCKAVCVCVCVCVCMQYMSQVCHPCRWMIDKESMQKLLSQHTHVAQKINFPPSHPFL